MRRANGAILSTVYWALGVAVGLVVLLVGFGAAVNFKVYHRDLETLRTESWGQIDARVQEVIAVKLGEAVRGIATELNERFDALSRDTRLLHAWDAMNDASRHEKDRHFEAAMISNGRWVGSALLLEDHKAVSEALDNMRRILGNEFTVSSRSLTLIAGFLDKLPPTYAIVAGVIRDGLARKVGAETKGGGGA